METDKPLNILTWHVHGNYLFYLSQIPHRIFLPVLPDRPRDYMGRGSGFPWGSNVVEIPFKKVKDLDLDCILFQRPEHYLTDQYLLLSERQRALPKIYLEHDPPSEHPTNTRHWVNDPETLLVHVTPFNRLMWDSGKSLTTVIEHGVIVPKEVSYQGTLEKGIVVINNLRSRGRRLGADIFERLSRKIPLDIVGMNAESYGSKEIGHLDLPYHISRYRFFFNPIRYTSLGLAVCEAMMIGMPVVGLATTEMTTVIQNELNGFVSTDTDELVLRMESLLQSPELALRIGQNAKSYAQKRFHIRRFVADWNHAITFAINRKKYSGGCFEKDRHHQ